MRLGRNFLIILSLFIISCANANTNIKSISEGDVNLFLKQAPDAKEHPNAGADILYAYDYTEFFEDGTSITKHIDRIKIFNERGRNLASKSISYREGYQEVKILFANTIKPDGGVVPLDQKDIQDSAEYAGYEFYTDMRVKKFTMPAVEDGCIIEYASEIKNLKPVLSFDYFDIFLFQNIYPVEKDIMEIVLPANIELKSRSFKTSLTPEIITDGNKKRYMLTNTKQKEIIPESRMPSLLDRETFPQIYLWTLNNWDEISKWYMSLVKEQMISDSELEGFTKHLIAGAKTDEDKINAIFSFVSQNIRYISVLLGPYTHKPHAANEIFHKRYGDCKDKTTLLLTMLKIAGIKGMPALVPSNGKYFDPSIPSLNVFNHVIAVVPFKDKYFWLDATNETAAYNSVPFSLPTKVFLMNEDGSYRFITTPELDDKNDSYSVDMKYIIDQEGNAAINYHYEYFGKAAEGIRYFFKYSAPEQRKKYFEDRGIQVKELHLGSFTDTAKPFEIRLTGSLKNLAQKLDEDIMVLSNIISVDSYRDITAASSRMYPINLSQSFYAREKSSYKFPAGFKIKKLPKDFTSVKPFKYLNEKYSFTGSIFNVYLESKSTETTIRLENLDDFKKYATQLQKHESSIKNIVFEKK
ncbi:MAG TPA: DUF3857 domain-containing protein [Smithella sp.]|nr:DUF3857 domain-containing protein [Smithella sp.]